MMSSVSAATYTFPSAAASLMTRSFDPTSTILARPDPSTCVRPILESGFRLAERSAKTTTPRSRSLRDQRSIASVSGSLFWTAHARSSTLMMPRRTSHQEPQGLGLFATTNTRSHKKKTSLWLFALLVANPADGPVADPRGMPRSVGKAEPTVGNRWF